MTGFYFMFNQRDEGIKLLYLSESGEVNRAEVEIMIVSISTRDTTCDRTAKENKPCSVILLGFAGG